MLSTIATLAGSAMGSVTKAVLVVKNPLAFQKHIKPNEEKLMQQFKAKGINVSKSQLHGMAMKMSGYTEKGLATYAQEMAKDIYSEAEAALSGMSLNLNNLNNMVGGSASAYDYIFIEVNYNPSSVVVSSRGDRYMEYDRSGALGASANSAIVERNQPVTKQLSFTMIIEDINNDDLFAPSMNTSVTVSNVADTVKSLYKDYSVTSKVEALLGLLTQSEYQDMFFCYGTMIFHGQLIELGVRYTMFNKKGNPVRAELSMKLLQVSGNMYKYDTALWNEKYNKAFMDK